MRAVALVALSQALANCSVLPAAGPSTRAVSRTHGDLTDGGSVAVVAVTDAVAGRLKEANRVQPFSEIFGDVPPHGNVVGSGDGLDITIWESPPAVLFATPMTSGSGAGTQSAAANIASNRPTDLPVQIVGLDGRIEVPFAGSIQAAGRSTQEIARDIRGRLRLKAHDPQVIVRITSNVTANVTVVGEVSNSVRMPLTAKGERLLDALASAGGVKQPVGKMTLQVTRGVRVDSMSLEAVIRDPRQNIRLLAGDVVTLLFQPYSFTVLGASRANSEVPFEATGLTLSQALGRMGGLDDQRANPKGVFIFRFEDPALFGDGSQSLPSTTKDGKVPVIYRVDMRDPQTLFVAQSFPIKDKDVIYVSNAPLADFSKFLQAVSQVVYPIATIQNTNIF